MVPDRCFEQKNGGNDFRVLIDESQAPDGLICNAVGYCVYHDIKHEFVFDTDKHQMAGFLALNRMGHDARKKEKELFDIVRTWSILKL